MDKNEYLNLKIKEVSERLVVVRGFNTYLHEYPRRWRSLNWVEFALQNVDFEEDDEMFVEILMKLLIEEFEINNRIRSRVIVACYKRISEMTFLSDNFIRKYAKYLDWNAIAMRRKMTFRFMWLMRSFLLPHQDALYSNKRIRRQASLRFVRYCKKEIKDYNGKLI